MLAAEYFRADHCLAAVRAEHQGFYRRAFNHQVICELRPYPQLAKPISLMTLHFPSVWLDAVRRYPFYGSTHAQRRMLFERAPCKQISTFVQPRQQASPGDRPLRAPSSLLP